MVLDYTNIKPFLECFVITASLEQTQHQKSSTGLIPPHWSTQELWFQQQMTITPLQSLFQNWRKLLHDFQALGVLSCYSTLASLRNSFLWHWCRGRIVAGQLHSIHLYWRLQDWEWADFFWPNSSMEEWILCNCFAGHPNQCFLGPSVRTEKSGWVLRIFFFLLAIFNLFCTSWTIWVCAYSTFLFTDVFISVFLFCNERHPEACQRWQHVTCPYDPYLQGKYDTDSSQSPVK